MLRLLSSLLWIVMTVTPAAAQSPLLGRLDTGPHPVGFRVIERFDPSRPYRAPFDLEGRPRPGNHARPLQIGVWYPAAGRAGDVMRLRDYVLLMGRERRFDVTPDEQRRIAENAFFALEIFRDAPSETRDRLLDLSTTAVRDATAAPGPFPVVIWSPGSAAIYQASAEYLASHGYIVAILPRVPETFGIADSNATRADYESKARDIAFLIGELSRFPGADVTRLAITGFSAGGRWAIAEAMRNPNVRAVVSHDSVLLFDDDNGEFRSMPFVQPERVRAPILHMVRAEWIPQERSPLWKEMRYAPRTHWTFDYPGLDHWDFTSAGYAATVVGLRSHIAEAVAHTFHVFNRGTLLFLDAHVRGDAGAAAKLADAPASLGVPERFITANTMRAPIVPSDLQFQDALADDAEGALAMYRKLWKELGTPPVSETTMNLAGYQLLGVNRVQDAIKVFAVNVEAFPASANVYDSLSDGYLAAGDEKKALELAEKAVALLPGDSSTPGRKDLIERSARQKIERLKPKSL